MNLNKKMYQKNLNLVIWETVLTSIGVGFSIATMTVFWSSLGISQKDIGIIQMLYTLVICILDIPMGYFADHFNRKNLNIIGDIGVACAFVFKTFSINKVMIIIAECLLGIFTAMTNGVDQSFIKYNCKKIDSTGDLFKKINPKIHTIKYIFLLIVMLIGGLVAKYNIRLTILLSSIPYFIGGIISFKIKDFNQKISRTNNNIFKDMIKFTLDIIKNNKIKVLLVGYIISREITRLQRWLFTPLLLSVGVPLEIVSLAWILSQLMQVIGGKISQKTTHLKLSKKFALPILLEISWMLILFLKSDIYTVWLFALNGFVQGLLDSSMITPLQEAISDKKQTSIISIASTGEKIIYIPLVYIVNYFGNINLQLALLSICIMFLPLCTIIYIKIKRI